MGQLKDISVKVSLDDDNINNYSNWNNDTQLMLLVIYSRYEKKC